MAQIVHFGENGESAADDFTMANRGSPQFLVSIRDANEAAIVQTAGVDWIDLKEPRSGALGRAELAVAQTVAEQLAQHAQRSAALGELHDLPEGITAEFAKLFPYLKVGLSQSVSCGKEDTKSSWAERFLSLAEEIRQQGSHLIPVIYADFHSCAAPHPSEVLAIARKADTEFLLIDTYTKSGLSLTDWLSISELQMIQKAAKAFGCGLVFAGSLKQEHISVLCALQPAALAVRGAVCSGDRAASICTTKVTQWCEWVRRNAKHPPSTSTNSFR